jgi:hypothetical protein
MSDLPWTVVVEGDGTVSERWVEGSGTARWCICE